MCPGPPRAAGTVVLDVGIVDEEERPLERTWTWTEPLVEHLEGGRRQYGAGPLGGDCVEVVEVQLRLLEGAGARGGCDEGGGGAELPAQLGARGPGNVRLDTSSRLGSSRGLDKFSVVLSELAGVEAVEDHAAR